MGLDNPIHLAFLLVVLLLVFGAKRLPEMGRSLGSGLRGFRDTISGEAAQAPAVQLAPATTPVTPAALAPAPQAPDHAPAAPIAGEPAPAPPDEAA